MQADDVRFLAVPLRRLQVVIGIMAVGAVAFLAVSIFVAGRRETAPDEAHSGLISLVAIGFAILQIGVSAILPQASIAAERRRIREGQFVLKGPGVSRAFGEVIETTGDAGRFFVLYQTRTILGAAMLEGAALFLCVAHMVEGEILTVAIAAVLIGILVLRIPTRERMVDWIERELRGLRGPKG